MFYWKNKHITTGIFRKIKENDFELLDTPTKAINETFHIRCKKCGREYNYKIQQTIPENLDCRFCGKKRPIVDLENCKKRFQERGFDKEFEILKYKNGQLLLF